MSKHKSRTFSSSLSNCHQSSKQVAISKWTNIETFKNGLEKTPCLLNDLKGEKKVLFSVKDLFDIESWGWNSNKPIWGTVWISMRNMRGKKIRWKRIFWNRKKFKMKRFHWSKRLCFLYLFLTSDSKSK